MAVSSYWDHLLFTTFNSTIYFSTGQNLIELTIFYSWSVSQFLLFWSAALWFRIIKIFRFRYLNWLLYYLLLVLIYCLFSQSTSIDNNRLSIWTLVDCTLWISAVECLKMNVKCLISTTFTKRGISMHSVRLWQVK